MRVTRIIGVAVVCLLITGGLAAQSFEKVPEAKQEGTTPAPSTAAGAKVALINYQAALLSTKEGQKAMQDLQARFRPQETELETLSKEISDYTQRLQTQSRTLSQDAQAELQREIARRRKKGTRLQEDLQEESDLARTDLMRVIAGKMQPIIVQYAQQNSLSLVIPLNPQAVPLFVAPGVDITQAIINLYDQANPVAAAASPGN